MIYGRSVRIPERYTRYLVVLDLTKDKFGYQMDLRAVAMDQIYTIEEDISLVGAGLGGGFGHTSELKVMKYDEATNLFCEKWEIPVEETHK